MMIRLLIAGFVLTFACLAALSGRAVADDGPIEITADTALEWNREDETFTARGNARVTQADTVLTADTLHATYDEGADGAMRLNTVTAKGGQPRLETPDETLTAETITARFAEQGTIETVTADGDVTVTTATETLTGNRAVYRPDAATVTVTGDVTITRGRNVIRGGEAVFDLTAKVSTMTGAGPEKRVRAVFFPGDKAADGDGERAEP